MKISKTILAGCIVLLASAPLSVIGEEEVHTPYAGSKAFQQMKQLAGNWEGTVDMGKGPQKIKASYRVSSAGSVLVETIFEGTPNEMVTIYHDEDEALSMTHYCMLGNRPEMDLTESNDSQLSFVLAKDAAIDVPNEPHMHALTITFQDDNKIDHAWTFLENGQEKEVHHITLSRVQ